MGLYPSSLIILPIVALTKGTLIPSVHVITDVDTGLSLCQETSERKLEAKVRELQQLMEEVKMLKDSIQQETEEKNRLQATITDKDVCLERAVADTDRLKAQLAEKEEQVGWVLVSGWDTGQGSSGKVEQVVWNLVCRGIYNITFYSSLFKESYTTKQNKIQPKRQL